MQRRRTCSGASERSMITMIKIYKSMNKSGLREKSARVQILPYSITSSDHGHAGAGAGAGGNKTLGFCFVGIRCPRCDIFGTIVLFGTYEVNESCLRMEGLKQRIVDKSRKCLVSTHFRKYANLKSATLRAEYVCSFDTHS